MPVPFILIRTDKLEYLQSFQEGNLFMRSCMYYQNMEQNDAARKDYLDGSIPATDRFFRVELPAKDGPIMNARFTELTCYIKSFHQYYEEDICQIDERTLYCEFSEQTKESIRSFGNEYAMIILGKDLFERFAKVCCSKKLEYGAGSVHYMNDKQYTEHEEAVLHYVYDMLSGIPHKPPDPRPALCKPHCFRPQQEFRFYLSYEAPEYKEFEKKPTYVSKNYAQNVFCQSYTLQLGSLTDISVIVPVSTILDNPIRLEIMNDRTIRIATKQR